MTCKLICCLHTYYTSKPGLKYGEDSTTNLGGNNNSPFSEVKNRAMLTHPMMNTRREGQCLPIAVQTRMGKETQALLKTTNISVHLCEADLLEDSV